MLRNLSIVILYEKNTFREVHRRMDNNGKKSNDTSVEQKSKLNLWLINLIKKITKIKTSEVIFYSG
jgi:hypothetical protein